MATKVTIFNNGPIRIEGEFTIVDMAGQEFGLAGARRSGCAAVASRKTSPFAMAHTPVKVSHRNVQPANYPRPNPKCSAPFGVADGKRLDAAAATPEYQLQIVHVYPHDTSAFTQGLEIHDGVFMKEQVWRAIRAFV